jgi:hypothetical protein
LRVFFALPSLDRNATPLAAGKEREREREGVYMRENESGGAVKLEGRERENGAG